MDKDKYDLAIEEINRRIQTPNVLSPIYEAWVNPDKGVAGCLFQFLNRLGKNSCNHCLTTFKSDYPRAQAEGRDLGLSNEVAQRLMEDKRIPDDVGKVEPEHLVAFAEWQRELDAMFPERVADYEYRHRLFEPGEVS